ncbi:MAG: FAD-dependent oxidoreductase [Nitrospiraceae bacterium]
MTQRPVLIIGAGPAGLTTAYELSKQGLSSTVLESGAQVGGISKTVNYAGYRFDIGGHRFFSKVPLINELWQEILGEEFLLRPRKSRIYYNEHFFDYPLKPINALIGLGPVESVLVALSYLKARFAHIHEERTFEDWVSNRFGYRLYRIFFKTYTEKVWGIPCTEISADWAAQRIKNLSLKQALRNALLGASRGVDGKTITSLIEQFHYPRFGPGMMWERCEMVIGQRGTRTVRGMHINRIRHARGRVESVSGTTSTGERTEFEGSDFVSTMPLRELMFALTPMPPAQVLDAAARLRYRDYLTVVLVVKREAVFPDNWIYIHSSDVKVGRIQNYKNWSPYMVPDPATTSLGLEYFLWDKDEEWSWPDEQLIQMGIRECHQLGLVDPKDVVDGTVVRMEKAYPVYDQTYQANVAVIRDYLATLPNLQTIGRNGLHRYNNQDHSMLTGIYAARNITGERWDVWSVNTEKEYHEEGRVAKLNPGDRLVPKPIAVPVQGMPTGLDRVLERAFAQVDPVAMGVATAVVGGVGIFLVTVILLIKGGRVVGPNLSLLAQFLPGFSVTWAGAVIGLVEMGLWGFLIGYASAWLCNQVAVLYVSQIRSRAEAAEHRDLLDKV